MGWRGNASRDQEIRLFAAFKPMLAAREPLVDIPNSMGTGAFVMELKLDGERIQLHAQDGVFRYFSRKGKDYTYLYGATAHEGSLSPFIALDCFADHVSSCILDGEMLAYDPPTDTFAPFTTLKSAALDRMHETLCALREERGARRGGTARPTFPLCADRRLAGRGGRHALPCAHARRVHGREPTAAVLCGV